VRGALLVSSLPTLARDFALALGIHACEAAPALGIVMRRFRIGCHCPYLLVLRHQLRGDRRIPGA